MWIISLLIVLLFPLRAYAACPGTTCSSVSDNGITFTFDKSYTCGNFVDDSWWCLTSGGSLTINSMTPSYSGKHHGWAVNYVTTTNPVDYQSFDHRITDLTWDGAEWEEPPGLPYVASADQSIIKVESVSPLDSTNCVSGSGVPRTCIQNAAVLTVLASDPTSGCAEPFRPPVMGSSKPIFCGSDINIDAVLPKLADVSGQISLSDALAAFGNWGPTFGGTRTQTAGRHHPIGSVKNIGGTSAMPYPCDAYTARLAACLRTTQSGTASEKRDLVYMCVQNGIDLYYQAANGRRFYADGGSNAGRKPLILYAGLLLNNAGMLDPDAVWTQYQEDQFVYYSSAAGEVLWGRSGTESGYDNCTCYGSCSDKTVRDPDQLRDGGKCKYGGYCPTGLCRIQGISGNPGQLLTPAVQRSSGHMSMADYQGYADWNYGAAALMRILNLDDEWETSVGHGYFFDYIERLRTSPWNYFCDSHCGQTVGAGDYIENMLRAYGDGGVWDPNDPNTPAPTPEIDVTITTDPDPPSGPSPLTVTVTGHVTGTATGDIQWKLDCIDTDSTWDQEVTSSSENYQFTTQCQYTANATLEVQATREGETDNDYEAISTYSPVAVDRFDLYNAETDLLLDIIDPNDIYMQSQYGTCLAIHILVSDDTESVQYDWTEPGEEEVQGYYNENNMPFCFRGDQGWIDPGVTPDCVCSAGTEMQQLGTHVLCVTPFPGDDQQGTPGDEFCRTFSLVSGFEGMPGINFTENDPNEGGQEDANGPSDPNNPPAGFPGGSCGAMSGRTGGG